MNILYFTNNFPSDRNPGPGIFLYNRIVSLLSLGVKVKVVSYTHTEDKNRYYHFKLKSILKGVKTFQSETAPGKLPVKISTILAFGRDEFPKYKFSSLSTLNKIADQLYQEYKASNSEVLHVHHLWYAYPAYLVKKKYGVPYIVTLHGSDIHETPFTSEENRNDALLLLNNAKKVIFVSDFLLRKAREIGFKGGNASVIPNGYDDALFNVKTTTTQASEQNIVGYVGNLIQSKGVLFLPEMFAKIVQQKPDVKFVLVGDGVERDNLTKQFSDLKILDKITFTGILKPHEVAEQMKRMNVLVLPSYGEGFGSVLIEAQACGAKVVASENGGTVEATKHTGRIVANGDNYALRFAEAVIELLNQREDRDEVQQSVQEYTWNNIVKKELEVYKRFIQTN